MTSVGRTGLITCHNKWHPCPLLARAAYGQTYYVTGSRQGDNGGGKWLLVPRDWTGEVPEVRAPLLAF